MTAMAEQGPSATAFLERAAKAMFPNERRTFIDVRTKSADGNTALHMAALWGEDAAVEQLLKSGAFVDEPGAGGRTALYYATLRGHLAVAARLIAAGADADRSTELGMSPRAIAHQLEDARLIRLFAG